jgi:hypothetical protein
MGVNGGTLNNWTLSIPNLTLYNDRRYRLQARSQDSAGNWSLIATSTFTFDVVKPTSTIIMPAVGWVKVLNTIAGTVTDSPNGENNPASLSAGGMRVAFKQISNGKWWNGVDFNTANVPQYLTTNLSGNATFWWIDTSAVVWESGETYLLISQGKDAALNQEYADASPPATVGITVGFDNQNPLAAISLPRDAGAYRAATMTTSTGTVSDSTTGGSGISSVHVILKRADPPPVGYWDPSDNQFVPTIQRSTVSIYSSSWSVTMPPLASNVTYYMWVEATDVAGNTLNTSDANIGNNIGGTWFTYDNVAPVTSISAPANNAKLNTPLTVISGAILDGQGSSGLSLSPGSHVRFRLQRGDDVTFGWWNGIADPTTAWGGSPTDFFITPTLLGDTTKYYQWSQTTPAGLWESNYRYKVLMRSIDLAGNTESPDKEFTFIYDTIKPTATITVPANNGYVASITTLSGAADDLSGYASPRNFESGISASGVEISLQRLSDNKWWDDSGPTFGSSQHWNTTSFSGGSSGTWTYSLPPATLSDNTTYYAIVRARDVAGNLQSVYTTNYFTVDVTTPVAMALFPASPPDVSLITVTSGTVQDTLPGKLDYVLVRIKEADADPRYWAGSSWTVTSNTWFQADSIDDLFGQPAKWTYDAAAHGILQVANA